MAKQKRETALSCIFLLLSIPSNAQSGNPGCGSGPCNNPVPCQDLYGVWRDSYGNQWSLDTNWGLGEQYVTGTVTTNPPGPTCPVVHYTVSGTRQRVWGTNTTPGTMSFTVTAQNPDQPSTPNCTVAAQTEYQGSVSSNGCDTGSGTWSNNLGHSGSFAWSRSACKAPDSNPTETTYDGSGWRTDVNYGSAYGFRAQVNASSSLNGRQVSEAFISNDDPCWRDDAPFNKYTISGGYWNVGWWGWSLYGDDNVGRPAINIAWMRANGRTPCTATVNISMRMACNSAAPILYKQNINSFRVTNTDITAGRDGVTRTKAW